MATSPETFNQVKNILRKLDRSIDEIRGRRTTPATSPNAPLTTIGGASNTPPGRARPLNRDPRNSF
ncbi:MAG: hypothetical protein J0L61_07750 [Planctomycetes bacterium]|nr:hypothetical protein [Planctomycetota bacterium]